MREIFIGREKELEDLNELYGQDKFQLFVLYGRRRVGKTTLLNEFCKGTERIICFVNVNGGMKSWTYRFYMI